jgi:hypothetical protein
VLAVARGARLSGYLDGTIAAPSKTITVEQVDKTVKMEENPVYASCYVQDQQLLSFLLNSVTKEALDQIAIETSVAGAWRVITGMFVPHSRAWIVHLRSKLASTCTAYYTMMKGFADEMAAAGKRLDDEDVICYILAGLDVDFNPFVEAFTAKTKPQTLHDLYSQLLIAEAWVESPERTPADLCKCRLSWWQRWWQRSHAWPWRWKFSWWT